ncbi:MAG: M90 family metallopeptidase [Deltaproteobacteria bacterium]
MFGFLRKRRRRKLREQPFPDEFRAIVERNFGLYEHLDPTDREHLFDLMKVFLGEKKFEGCGGLELNDEIRVTIAAQACLLMLHQEEPHFYPRLHAILVYPHAYVATQRQVIAGGLVLETPSARLGESWVDGVVVLSWDDARAGASCANDGHNVVLHEFAHQLDQEDGTSDGAPILDQRSQYVAWARVLGHEFEELRENAEAGRRTDIDSYGATNAAEFFAVITEAFFEKPKKLRRKHPELYEELQLYYKQDPAVWGR